MLRFRRPRHRFRIALVAIAALLWSQFVLAGHWDCFLTIAPSAHAHLASQEHDCGGQRPATGAAVCSAHCNQGDVSADSGRIPPVPPLPSSIGLTCLASVSGVDVDGAAAPPVDASPPVSWHRPTAHPAALLLI